MTWASRPGPGRPRSIGKHGSGACTMVSSAAEFRAHDLHHFERRGDVFEEFGYVFAELAQHRAAATRTGRRRFTHDALTRQLRRHRLAAVLGILAAARRREWRLASGSRSAFRHAFFEFAEREF